MDMSCTCNKNKKAFETSLKKLEDSFARNDNLVKSMEALRELEEATMMLPIQYNPFYLKITLSKKILESLSLKMKISLFSVIGYALKNEENKRFFDVLNNDDKYVLHLDQWYKGLTSKFSLLNDEAFLRKIVANFLATFKILGVVTDEKLDLNKYLLDECPTKPITATPPLIDLVEEDEDCLDKSTNQLQPQSTTASPKGTNPKKRTRKWAQQMFSVDSLYKLNRNKNLIDECPTKSVKEEDEDCVRIDKSTNQLQPQSTTVSPKRANAKKRTRKWAQQMFSVDNLQKLNRNKNLIDECPTKSVKVAPLIDMLKKDDCLVIGGASLQPQSTTVFPKKEANPKKRPRKCIQQRQQMISVDSVQKKLGLKLNKYLFDECPTKSEVTPHIGLVEKDDCVIDVFTLQPQSSVKISLERASPKKPPRKRVQEMFSVDDLLDNLSTLHEDEATGKYKIVCQK